MNSRLTALHKVVSALVVACAGLCTGTANAAITTNWQFFLMPYNSGIRVGPALEVGAKPSASDTYDGSDRIIFPVAPLPDPHHAGLLVYHEQGLSWSGDTGLYANDYHAPIPAGRNSTTWENIYLWGEDSWTSGPTITIFVDPYWPPSEPYNARLYLDYVPASCGWTGPVAFDIGKTGFTYLELPINITSNPLDGVRMHFTVVTPEPSSVLALGLPVIGMAGMLLRRRWR